ncbi:MAG: hypothetical protein OES13_03640 [Acidimicrobiia bacterium]|nr:hypothetical protein [Acidimicrobiia bacterium]
MTLPSQLTDAFAEEWQRLAKPGATLDGAGRVEVAVTARAAYAGAATPEEPVHQAASTISASPASIREAWVEGIASEIGYPTYVEVAGVVARLTAVDTVHRALGLELMALPQPEPGEPTGEVDPDLRKTSAWVPMKAASVVYALGIVPAEMRAQEIMSGPLYMTYEAMDDPAHPGVITRAQKELVASRTSAINECFY